MRPKKYNEETVQLNIRVPKSKKQAIKTAIFAMIEQSDITTEKAPQKPQNKPKTESKTECVCTRNEKGLFIRSKPCKIPASKHQ